MAPTFFAISAVVASAPSVGLLIGTATTVRPAAFADAVILSFMLTASGSSGLNRMPMRLALGATFWISATRARCSGSPRPGE